MPTPTPAPYDDPSLPPVRSTPDVTSAPPAEDSPASPKPRPWDRAARILDRQAAAEPSPSTDPEGQAGASVEPDRSEPGAERRGPDERSA
jgi:hypothetical protein